MSKRCPEGKIVNPATGRCVLKTGKIGKSLLKGVKKSKRVPKPVIKPAGIKFNLELEPRVVGFEKDVSSARGSRIMSSNKERVEYIVRDALYGFDVTKYNYKRGIIYVEVVPNASFPDDRGMHKEYIIDNFGDGAADSWMEGDITIPEDKHNELHLNLIKIE